MHQVSIEYVERYGMGKKSLKNHRWDVQTDERMDGQMDRWRKNLSSLPVKAVEG